jgi:hypothetical protein
MEDAAAGRKLRLLTILDEFTRESLEIAVARSLPAQVVIEVLSGRSGRSPAWPYPPHR